MRRLILALTFTFVCNISFGQNKAAADKLIDEGVVYHDQGDYHAAIVKYDEALQLDKDNLSAMAEKAFSLLSLEKLDEALDYCQKAIAKHLGDKALKTVYVTYGNALDGQKKTKKSLEIYDEGIKLFPDYYQLYFNKGISLSGIKNYDEAMVCFQRAAKLNPNHASSHNAIAVISNINNNKIPSLLAYCRFLSVETQSERAKQNLSKLQKMMIANVKKTAESSITVTINADLFTNATSNKKTKENDFSSTDLVLSMAAAMDFDEKNREKTEVEQFIRKLETVCASLKETKKKNYGFFWEYYVPYFVAMKDKNFIETYAYIAFASREDSYVSDWLEKHQTETNEFFEWSDSFE